MGREDERPRGENSRYTSCVLPGGDDCDGRLHTAKESQTRGNELVRTLRLIL